MASSTGIPRLRVLAEVFQNDPDRWAAIMRSTIALNASFLQFAPHGPGVCDGAYLV